MKDVLLLLLTVLEEEPGTLSSSRLMYVIGSFYAMGFGIWVYSETHDVKAAVGALIAMYAPFATQRTIQKQQEK